MDSPAELRSPEGKRILGRGAVIPDRPNGGSALGGFSNFVKSLFGAGASALLFPPSFPPFLSACLSLRPTCSLVPPSPWLAAIATARPHATGILSLPHAFSSAGLVAGILCYLLVGFGVMYGNLQLLRVKHELTRRVDASIATYSEVGQTLFGSWGRFFVEAQVVILELAFCCGFVIVGLDNMEAVVGRSAENRLAIILVATPILVFLAWIRWLKDLWVLSFLGLLVYVGGVMGISYYDGALNIADDVNDPGWHRDAEDPSLSNVILFIGVAVYSLEGINLVLPVENSLKHPRNAERVIATGMTLYTVLCCAFGAFAYLAGLGSCPLVTNCFTSGGIATGVRIALCASLIVTHPLTLFPASEIIERRLFGIIEDEAAEARLQSAYFHAPHEHTDASRPVSNFELHLDEHTGYDSAHEPRSALHAAPKAATEAHSLLGRPPTVTGPHYDAVRSSATPSAPADSSPPASASPPALSSPAAPSPNVRLAPLTWRSVWFGLWACGGNGDRESFCSPAQQLVWKQRALRTGMVLFTCVVGWALPDFRVFADLIGSLMMTLVGFVMPATFYIRTFGWSELSWVSRIICIISILFGLAIMVIGTIQSVEEIIETF